MVKQVIILRSDLGLRKGQLAAQAAHASMIWLTERIKAYRWEDWMSCDVMSDEEDEWVLGTFTKIVLRVDSEEELMTISQAAEDAELTWFPCRESGLGGILTAIAIGPHESELIDPITGHLKPY